jgi:hypothetical protein
MHGEGEMTRSLSLKKQIKNPPGSPSRLRQGEKMKEYWALRRSA